MNIEERAIPTFLDPTFQAELHRLLWIPPFVNAGEFDAGWGCRDHAVTLATFLAVKGVPSDLVHGRCMFIQGPLNGAPPVGIGQDLRQASGHSWLDVIEGGIVDLSPNLTVDLPGRWRSIPFAGILLNHWAPPALGRLVKCTNAQTYEAEVARATHDQTTPVAVYFEQKREALDAPGTILAAQDIDSPLSVRVYERYGPFAYLAAVLHLLDFVGGRARGIAGVSHNKAWQLVVERYPEPVVALASIVRENAGGWRITSEGPQGVPPPSI